MASTSFEEHVCRPYDTKQIFLKFDEYRLSYLQSRATWPAPVATALVPKLNAFFQDINNLLRCDVKTIQEGTEATCFWFQTLRVLSKQTGGMALDHENLHLFAKTFRLIEFLESNQQAIKQMPSHIKEQYSITQFLQEAHALMQRILWERGLQQINLHQFIDLSSRYGHFKASLEQCISASFMHSQNRPSMYSIQRLSFSSSSSQNSAQSVSHRSSSAFFESDEEG